jgi:hypothetical protein
VSRAVSLDVCLRLTDRETAPLPGIAARVVFGADSAPDAGTRVMTDSAGEARFTATVQLRRRLRKLPTNFFSSLFSLPSRTEFLRIGTELPCPGGSLLFTADVDRYPGGDPIGLTGRAVRGPDATGRFLRDATPPQPGGTSDAGWEIADWRLHPLTEDRRDDHWTLSLAYVRSPAPVRR